MDLTQTGLRMYYLDYQIEVLKQLWNNPEGLTSLALHKKVNAYYKGKKTISRASIIIFLNDLTDMNYVRGEKEKRRRGYAIRYKIIYTEDEFKQHLIDKTIKKLHEQFPDALNQTAQSFNA
jgi:predicted transcriptional regulator